MAANIARFMPSNIQLLAQRQHEELLETREQLAEVKDEQLALEAVAKGLMVENERLRRRNRELELERDATMLMLARRDRWRRLWRRLVA